MADTQRALEAPLAGWELAGVVQRIRANPVLVTGLLLILASLWWKAGLLGQSSFRLDDFLYLEHASTQGLTWSYLTWVDAGHLDIVGAAVAWVAARTFPFDWTFATAVTLVLLAGACFALLRMLRTLFGDRPGILVLLVLYLLNPLSLPGLSWWTVALEQLPLQAAVFCAVTAHVHYLRTRDFRHAVAAAAWLAVAMLSAFQGAAAPLLLFALTSAFFAPGRWSRALWPTARDHWRAWALYAALTAGYVALYLVRLQSSSLGPAKPPAFDDVLSYAGTLVRQTLVPGAFGGPWRWGASGVEAITVPPPALAAMSWVLAIVVILMSLTYAWRSWRAWAILAGWLIAVDIIPVLAGRSSLIPGVVLGVSARYAWDATAILVLVLGLAFLPLAGAPGPQRAPRRLSRPEFAAATTVVTAIVFGSLWSFYAYPADPTAAQSRSYIATARIALANAPQGAVIVDAPVPAYVTGGLFAGSPGMASTVLSTLESGPAASRPAFTAQPDGTYYNLLEFNGFGQLVPSTIYGVASQPRPGGAGCWPATAGGVSVRLNSTPASASTLRIGYVSGGTGQVLISFGPQWSWYTTQPGPHVVILPLHGATAGTVVIQSASGTMPCVTDAEAGVLLPSTNGIPIPQFAVTG